MFTLAVVLFAMLIVSAVSVYAGYNAGVAINAVEAAESEARIERLNKQCNDLIDAMAEQDQFIELIKSRSVFDLFRLSKNTVELMRLSASLGLHPEIVESHNMVVIRGNMGGFSRDLFGLDHESAVIYTVDGYDVISDQDGIVDMDKIAAYITPKKTKATINNSMPEYED